MNLEPHESTGAPDRSTQAGGRTRSRRRRYDHTIIVQLYTNGSTMQQVAAKVGCNTSTVRRALQNAGIPRRRRHFPPVPPPPALTPAQAAEVVRMYAEMKLEVWQIIRRTSHSAPSVKRALREAGIPMRRGKLGKAGWPDADIAFSYQRGDSIGRIAVELGMAEQTVRNRLDATGVPRRPPPRTPDDVKADFVHRYTRLHQPIGRIVKQTGRSRTAVKRALIAAGHLQQPTSTDTSTDRESETRGPP